MDNCSKQCACPKHWSPPAPIPASRGLAEVAAAALEAVLLAEAAEPRNCEVEFMTVLQGSG